MTYVEGSGEYLSILTIDEWKPTHWLKTKSGTIEIFTNEEDCKKAANLLGVSYTEYNKPFGKFVKGRWISEIGFTIEGWRHNDFRNETILPIGRWVSINGEPLHIQFNQDATYINGVSVQYQDENLTLHEGPTYNQDRVIRKLK